MASVWDCGLLNIYLNHIYRCAMRAIDCWYGIHTKIYKFEYQFVEKWTKTCGKMGLKCQIGLKMELISNDTEQQVVPIEPQFLYICICI